MQKIYEEGHLSDLSVDVRAYKTVERSLLDFWVRSGKVCEDSGGNEAHFGWEVRAVARCQLPKCDPPHMIFG